jgi:outer membrane protein
MKRLPLILSAVAILLAAVSFYFAKSSSELVYVDVNKLIEGYKRTKVEKVNFEKKSTKMKSDIDTLISNWQKELQNYEKERTSLSAKELQLKQELLSNKQEQVNNYQETIKKQIQAENKKVTQTVVNDINEYIKEYGKKHRYKIIFGASGGGNIMYADETTDLTEDVLKGLNYEYENK